MQTVVPPPETSEIVTGPGALNRDGQGNETQVDEHSEAKKPPQKSARKLAQERLNRGTAHLNPKEQQESEDQLD